MSEAPAIDEGAAEAAAARPKVSTKVRLIGLGLFLVAAYVVAVQTGVTSMPAADLVAEIRTLMTGLGVVGFLLYIAVFCVGELMQVPGMIFMVAAVIAYGPYVGGFAAFLGGILSVSFTFGFVRFVGGQPLGDVKWEFARKILARLDERPILVVAILRLMFTLSPVLNYALAMSSVRWRDYLIGSLIGFAPWAVAVAAFAEWFLQRLTGS